MLYLGEEHIRQLGMPWSKLMDVVEGAISLIDDGDYAQPLKPYLRYGNPRNRIITMPAYIGGSVQAAGIKWIASFPGNIAEGLPRAHSVTLLNDAATGVPAAVVNTALVSGIRTAAVSGVMLRQWQKARQSLLEAGRSAPIRVGIIGFGPIGRLHSEMCRSVLGSDLGEVYVYDIGWSRPGTRKPITTDCLPDEFGGTRVASDWEEIHDRCDVVIACTVSSDRYYRLPLRKGTLHLDVSLRDYAPEALDKVKAIVVDDWQEVCRENTDIELLHLQKGLAADDVWTLGDIACRAALMTMSPEEPVLFCPMGMAAFDIAIAHWYAETASRQGVGIRLP